MLFMQPQRFGRRTELPKHYVIYKIENCLLLKILKLSKTEKYCYRVR